MIAIVDYGGTYTDATGTDYVIRYTDVFDLTNAEDGRTITFTSSNYHVPEVRWEPDPDNDLWLLKREWSLEGQAHQAALHERPCRYAAPAPRAARAHRPTIRSSSTGVRNFRAK